MIILSVRQPWAALLISGVKKIETRTWATKHRGQIGIQAGLSVDSYGPLWRFPAGTQFVRGAVVGTVNIVDCRPMTKADEDMAQCDWREGLFAWVCVEENAFSEPIPMKGHLGLREVALP